MGRFRRNRVKKNRANQGSEGASKSGATQSTPKKYRKQYSRNISQSMSAGDRKFLVNYLLDYQKGAFAVLRGESWKDKLSCSIRDCPATASFDSLTEKTLSQPYLIFPKDMTPSQRKVTHEIATDLGLYHASFGEQKQGNRYVAVSIYYDGFQHLASTNNAQIHQRKNHEVVERMSKLKPWILRRSEKAEEDSEEITRKKRMSILELLDQPGDSLREGIDSLDFKALETSDLSQTTPPSLEDTNWMLVDNPERMKQCVEEITESGSKEIAFDLEAYNESKYLQATCLIQLATSSGQEYVIDTLAPGVWESVRLLAPLFESKEIAKVGHSIGGLDVHSLHRDFGIFVVNAFDTYEASRCLNLSSNGLAKVCEHYGLPNCSIYESLKAKYQTCDWTRRPLTKPRILYGRYDVHYLILLRKLMMRDLAKSQLYDKGRHAAEALQVRMSMAAMMMNFDEDEEIFLDATSGVPPTIEDDPSSYEDTVEKVDEQTVFVAHELRMVVDLMRVISRSQDRCLDLWTERSEPPLRNSYFQAHLLRSKSSGNEWSPSQIRLYESLAKWRERIANEERCSTEYVCPLDFLVAVAYTRPTNVLSLRRVSFDLPGMLEGINTWGEIFALVRMSRVEDGLDEYESMADFPSFVEGSRNILSKRGVYDVFTGRSWTLVVGVAIMATFALSYKGKLVRDRRP